MKEITEKEIAAYRERMKTELEKFADQDHTRKGFYYEITPTGVHYYHDGIEIIENEPLNQNYKI